MLVASETPRLPTTSRHRHIELKILASFLRSDTASKVSCMGKAYSSPANGRQMAFQAGSAVAGRLAVELCSQPHILSAPSPHLRHDNAQMHFRPSPTPANTLWITMTPMCNGWSLGMIPSLMDTQILKQNCCHRPQVQLEELYGFVAWLSSCSKKR